MSARTSSEPPPQPQTSTTPSVGSKRRSWVQGPVFDDSWDEWYENFRQQNSRYFPTATDDHSMTEEDVDAILRSSVIIGKKSESESRINGYAALANREWERNYGQQPPPNVYMYNNLSTLQWKPSHREREFSKSDEATAIGQQKSQEGRPNYSEVVLPFNPSDTVHYIVSALIMMKERKPYVSNIYPYNRVHAMRVMLQTRGGVTREQMDDVIEYLNAVAFSPPSLVGNYNWLELYNETLRVAEEWYQL